MNVEISLNIRDVESIRGVLGKMPHDTVRPLIDKIVIQTNDQKEEDQQKNIDLVLGINDTNLILEVLGEVSYKQVKGLIEDIAHQAQESVRLAEEKERIEAEASIEEE